MYRVKRLEGLIADYAVVTKDMLIPGYSSSRYAGSPTLTASLDAEVSHQADLYVGTVNQTYIYIASTVLNYSGSLTFV